jgi:hypothetical protein
VLGSRLPARPRRGSALRRLLRGLDLGGLELRAEHRIAAARELDG